MRQRRTSFTLSSKLALLTLALGVLSAQVGPVVTGGPQMPLSLTSQIGTPQSLGAVGSNVSGGSISFATSAGVSAGDLIVVCSGVGVGNTTSVSDGTNTYSLAIAKTGALNATVAIYYVQNAAALVSGTTITINNDSGGTAGASALRISGIKTSGALDKTASAATSSSS